MYDNDSVLRKKKNKNASWLTNLMNLYRKVQD